MTVYENPFARDPDPTVPEDEMDITFVRSSGPGGQKVNKTSSKAMVRWNVDASSAFSDAQKARIREKLGYRITNDGDLIVTCMQERSQFQNKLFAIQTLRDIVAAALEVEKERKPTKPTKGARERRIEDKKRTGSRKRDRRDWAKE
jgi:ribosome-associated protein